MLRVLWVGGFFFGTLPFMIAMQWVLRAIGSPLWGPASRAYYRALCKALRIRIGIGGALVTGRPVLIASNHISWADIAVLGAVAPMVFVAKREVGRWPLIGAAARVMKVVFVDRERRQETAGTVTEIAQRLSQGHPVVLFAEGTSSDGNRVLPFRSALIGAVETACVDAGLGEVLIQPMSICYTRQHGLPMGRQMRPLVAWYGDLDFFPHFTEFLRRGAVDAVVTFGDPVPATAAADRKAMAKTLEKTVRAMTSAALRAGIPFSAGTR